MVAERDKQVGISSTDKRANREDIAVPPIDPGANAWEEGHVVKIADPTGVEHISGHATKPAFIRSAEAHGRKRTRGDDR